MPTWAYIVAALLGSLIGAALDAVLYADGGSMFMKIGLVALPIALSLVGKARTQKEEE